MARQTQRGSTNFPQLGGEPERYHQTDREGTPKFTDKGSPITALRFPGAVNLKDPRAVHAAVGNMAHSIESAPAHSLEEGRQWYPKVNEATRKGVSQRGFLSNSSDKMLSGAGLVAAVSPNMDWDSANIGAFSELRGLKAHHWDAIMSAGPGKSRQALAGRQAAKDAVNGLSISRTPMANLQKAGRIIRGEHPDDVLDQRGAPKTNNFMHNIADPSDNRFGTVDGRAFDTMTNRLRPWQQGRGISSAGGSRGTSRYEDARGVLQTTAGMFGMHTSEAQAVSWVHTKYNLEQGGFTKSGKARSQGPSRVGQAYFHQQTGEPVLHLPHLGGQFR